MNWPAPEGRPLGARLIGGPNGGKIVRLSGLYATATPSIYANGYIGQVGTYEWLFLPSREIVGQFEAFRR